MNGPFTRQRQWIVTYDFMIDNEKFEDEELTVTASSLYGAFVNAQSRIYQAIREAFETGDVWFDIWEISQVEEGEA